MIFRFQVRKSRTLSAVMKNLTDIPDSVFMMAQEEGASTVDFSKNKLATVPEGYVYPCINVVNLIIFDAFFFRLSHLEAIVTELNLSHNCLATFPPFISQFSRIAYLNLSNNQFIDLPKQIGLLNTLRELNISNNR